MPVDIYYTEKTSLKLNLFYLHCFMLSHALQRLSTSRRLHSNLALEGVFPKAWQFETLLSRFIERDNVYIYGTEFDSQVHEELKRQRRCLYRALTDYYMFGNSMQSDLTDIVYYDLLNEQEEDSAKVQKLSGYIEETISRLLKDKDVQKVMVKEEDKFTWGLLIPKKVI